MNSLFVNSFVWLHTLAQNQPTGQTPGRTPGQPGEPSEVWGSRAQEVFDSWQNTSDMFPVRNLVIILAVFAVIMFGLWLSKWYKNRPVDPTPSLLFRKMSRELRLGLMDQWLLLRICREQHLPSPLTLLLSRATLLHYANEYAKELAPIRTPMVLARAQRIVNHLFGSEAQANKDTLAAMKQANFQVIAPTESPNQSESPATPEPAATPASPAAAKPAAPAAKSAQSTKSSAVVTGR